MKRILFIICLLLSATVYSQEKRLALIIGNSAYEHGGPLKNPVNDADSMKQALTQVGFEVLGHFNLRQAEMKMAIDYFGMKLRDYDVGLFYYAGHGIQSKGNNYLIPVDANLLSENDVDYNCIDAGRILGKMEDAANRTNIVILDACRNNPFERSWTRSVQRKGLASMDAPLGSILAYATAPGNTASDGEGNNGLYTSALVKTIPKSGLSIEEVFKQVRVMVVDQSNGTQTPWESTSLTGDFYFRGSADYHTPTTALKEVAMVESIAEPDKRDVPAKGVFVDNRDKQEYKWVKIGDQIWMAENLNYSIKGAADPKPPKGSKWDKKLMGLIYSMELANENCPDGWHLPSVEEWTELIDEIGSYNAGGKLKSVDSTYWHEINEGADNSSGFSALPIGGASAWLIIVAGTEAVFWSSTEFSLKKGYTYGFYSHSSDVHTRTTRKNMYISVRCIKDP